MAGRTHYAVVAALVAVFTVAAYLPDTNLYRTSPSSNRVSEPDARIAGASTQARRPWRSRPVTAVLSGAALLVPIGSRAARITTALTLAAAIVTALTAALVLRLGGSTSAAMASALGLGFGAAFAAQATTPASNLAECALCLGLIGFFLWRSDTRGWRRSTSVAFAAAIVALGFAAVVIPFYILLGLAMSVFVRWAAPYGRRAATMMIFLVPLLNGIEQYRTVRNAVHLNALAAAVAEALPNALPANAVVVASDAQANPVLGYWQIGMPAPPLIDSRASAVMRTLYARQDVFAFASSINSLEASGLHFETERPLETTILLEDYLEQLPFRSIVVVGSGPRGAVDPATSAPFHGSIGIVGPLGVRVYLERSHILPVDLRLEAGDPIGSTMLAPVPIRVVADDSGIIIDVDRRNVVHTPAGRALAVVTPAGRLLAAHAIDADARPALPVEAPEFHIGRLHMPARK